ncbi:pentatricopeptide repeat-containing protein At2g45350, chloroplastic-like isoform X2 [Zingiber officinale]|uniref:pentatricopeptide repeat-containing protein At2g45350, chloroplastic-like isoform X2 n=1 Tax=Zingiber officinale TaxID=94328 RepID=UPI001C4B5F80|nr:pentatricopeptide repeat-containing protein At2g45350, chloroplastic-like isoform X2 [Zingiber officinale]XP_042399075.1 pentatricopeptide repeat-containing protein At2g45350, chloroplastic-like isoform X2 [Zingiber officinale]XP_042399076.1 pentatricopeptide repeat-containing protein At2g45350, chloroplastic-like isoform X2 [Zingiber officinale]
MGRLLARSKMLENCAFTKVDDSHPFFWNSIIRRYERNQEPRKAIITFCHMMQRNISPDKFTFPFILKACASAMALREGEQIHCHAIKSPYNSDLFVQGSLIFMYASCQEIDSARASFDAMPYKNLISWNMIIDAYIKHGRLNTALEIFAQMPERDLFSWNLMIDGFAKNGQMEFAQRMFDEMPGRDIVSWNSIINGYAKCRDMTTARKMFDQSPFKDEVTWGIMLNGYAKCGRITTAHTWFEKLPYKNAISWNCLINRYLRCDDVKSAQKLFDLMPNRNVTSFNIMLDDYMKKGELQLAYQMFYNMPVKDVTSWNIIIDGNARLGRMKVARELFDVMPCRDVVSWNSLIAGYKENGESKEAIEVFIKMIISGKKPDNSTLAMVLSAVADLGLIFQGRWIHLYIDKHDIPLDGIVGVALIDMYSKCGYVDIALSIFNSIPQKERDHWNSMISGSAVHGRGNLAINLFEKMQRSMVKPDDITFIGLLSACSHAGLVAEGRRYFNLMISKYGITPKIQHYGCMVDLLSRAGHLEEAISLVNDMPLRANDIIWRALLGASKNQSNVEIAERAVRNLIELDPCDSSSYVLLSNIYACRDQYESAGEVWRTMKSKGVPKNTGCSCIEVDGVIHEFTVGHIAHPQIDLLLHSMTQALRLEGYLPCSKGSVGLVFHE